MAATRPPHVVTVAFDKSQANHAPAVITLDGVVCTVTHQLANDPTHLKSEAGALMSVWPVASHTRTSDGTAITVGPER